MRRLLTLAFAFLSLPLHAACTGQNLIAALPASEQAALTAAANAVPYPQGNFWQATRDGQTITLAGTYHMDDPRHLDAVTLLSPLLSEASTLLVEAGPAEMSALKSHLAANPDLLLNTTGPTLPEALPKADWLRLSDALRARGIPPFMAARMQPWYLSTLLSIPACMMADAAAMNGLDQRLIQSAEAIGLPITALEPYDTIFTIFGSFSNSDQIAMLMQALDTGNMDMAATLADAYFAGESRLIWEFTKQQLAATGLSPAEVDRELALIDDAMITTRNRSWIAPIEAAAAQGPILVAFGALHLSGETGVLNLLAQNGWTLTPLTP